MQTRTITALELQKRNPRQVNLYLDGDFAFAVSLAVVQEKGLYEGQVLSPAEVEDLQGAECRFRARETALGFLSHRPRSEAEVRRRLRRNGFDEAVVEETLAALREQGLVDDVAFADLWVQNRSTFRPRGAKLIRQELRIKGVDDRIVREATEGMEEDEIAYRCGQKRARSLLADDYAEFRRRLGAFLLRRGFDYDVVERTVRRLWDEFARQVP